MKSRWLCLKFLPLASAFLRAWFFGLIALLAVSAHAATVYRSVDANGKVIYSDKPPPDGKVQKTLAITNGPASPLPESVLK